jgi:hypothetical protein
MNSWNYGICTATIAAIAGLTAWRGPRLNFDYWPRPISCNRSSFGNEVSNPNPGANRCRRQNPENSRSRMPVLKPWLCPGKSRQSRLGIHRPLPGRGREQPCNDRRDFDRRPRQRCYGYARPTGCRRGSETGVGPNPKEQISSSDSSSQRFTASRATARSWPLIMNSAG